MKEALDKEGLKPHLMIQPIGYHAPDCSGDGFQYLPETPFGELVCFPSMSNTVVLMLVCVAGVEGVGKGKKRAREGVEGEGKEKNERDSCAPFDSFLPLLRPAMQDQTDQTRPNESVKKKIASNYRHRTFCQCTMLITCNK